MDRRPDIQELTPERLPERHSSRPPASVLIAAGVALLWMLTLAPFLSFGSSNHRLVEAFGPDEAMQLNLLHDAVARRSFALEFGPYGHLGFNLILLILRAVPGPITDAHILYVGRALGVVFAAATALLTFVWARRAYGTGAAWIAFSLLLVNQTLYLETAELNPDLGQLFFLMLALAFLVKLAEESRPKWLMLASIAAGLAFAAKYSGLFILPVAVLALMRRPPAVARPDSTVMLLRGCVAVGAVMLLLAGTIVDDGWIASHLTSDGRIDSPIAGRLLALARLSARGGGMAALLLAVVPSPWSWLRRRKVALAVVWFTAVMAVVFVATFAIASPYSLRKAAFIRGLVGEVAYAVPLSVASIAAMLRGFGVAIEWPVLWAALGTAAWLALRVRRRPAPVTATDVVLIAWLVIYALVLIAPVHEVYIDYALPLAPPAAMLAGRGATVFTKWFGTLIGRPALTVAALCVVLIGVELALARTLVERRNHHLARAISSDQMYVATWLECHADTSARVAYDHFVYVSPAFADASVTWGGTREWLASLNPDIVVTNRETAVYASGQAQNAAYYECLAAGTCGYERVLARGDLTVYGRQARLAGLFTRERPRVAAPRCF